MKASNVLIVGGGVAGLSTALDLAEAGFSATVVEQNEFAGGHGIRFACKAVEECVRCGACVVEEKLKAAASHPRVRLLTGARLQRLEAGDGFSCAVEQRPRYIDPKRCTSCGACFRSCPDNAIRAGVSAHQHPFYALQPDRCRRMQKGDSCDLCRKACPENAVDLEARPVVAEYSVDAVVSATGFQPYTPLDKPYGYGRFDNVITNLTLEEMLRQKGRCVRPSDGTAPDKIAFIQCVGSRDRRRGHLWCSQVCCGSALRMARWIRGRRPETGITVFYIDIQTFGKDFEAVYGRCREEMRFVRAIPADIFAGEQGGLELVYTEAGAESTSENFDMVVLSVGLTPRRDGEQTASMLGAGVTEDGFMAQSAAAEGVFVCGAAKGPMGIADSVADASRTAWQVRAYLVQKGR